MFCCLDFCSGTKPIHCKASNSAYAQENISRLFKAFSCCSWARFHFAECDTWTHLVTQLVGAEVLPYPLASQGEEKEFNQSVLSMK